MTAAILPAGLEARVEQVFARLGPDLALRSARIGATQIDAVVCDAARACSRLQLTAPEGCTDGHAAGPFCARWPDGAPPFAGRVEAAWSQQKAVDFWQQLPATTSPPDAPPQDLPVLTATGALQSVAIPLLVGAALTLGMRRLHWPIGLQRALAPALVLVALAGWLASPMPPGLWEGLWATALALLGALLAAAGPARAALVMGVLSLALAGVELGLRALPPADRPDHPAWFSDDPWASPNLHQSDGMGRMMHWQTYACRTMQPASAKAFLPESTETRPLTLHLGDSLVHGLTLPAGSTLAAQLDRSDRQWRHVHGAMPGTSVDAALVVLRSWAPILRPTRVILHLYTGNDLLEVGADYPCCGHQPLLDWSAEGLPGRCPASDSVWLQSDALATLVWASPPPYAWRWLAPHSATAAQLSRGLVGLAHGHGRMWRDPLPQQLARYQRVLRQLANECARQGIELLLTIAPDAEAMRGAPDHLASLEAIRGLLASEGYVYWDAHAAFMPLWQQEGPTAYLHTAQQRDMHLNAAGHERWAALLAAWLRARDATAP